MPLSFRQAGNTFIQGPNISIYPSGNSYAISGSASSTGSTGFSAITSAGTGNRLILSSITNNTLIYKSLTGTSNLSIDDNNNGTLTFSLAGGGTGTIISGVNIGTNANSLSFFTGLSTTTNANDTLAFRNILAGPNIFINTSVGNDGDILISRGSPILVNQISNIGGGARFLSSITSNSAITRTIANASGFSSALGAGIITIPTSSTDSDSTAFITAASITDARQIAAIQNLVKDLKTNNLWTKMLAIYPFVGGTATTHKYNLKDPRDLDDAYRLSFLGGGWTHDANGATPNGTTSYADSFFTPSLHNAVDSSHLTYYSRTLVNESKIEIGCYGGVASNFNQIAISFGGTTFCNPNNSGAAAAVSFASNSQGFFLASRTSATDVFGQRNLVQVTGTAATTRAAIKIFLGALNGFSSGPSYFSSKQCAFASIGNGLTINEGLILYNLVEAYQTSLERQVVTLQNETVRISPTNTTSSLLYISNATSQLGTSANFGADATTGSLGIGGAAVTTSRLLIAAGTGAISQLRLTAFSASTSLIDGDIWYSTSGNTLKFYKNNISTDFIFKDNNISLTGLSNPVLLVADTEGTLSKPYINSFGIFNALSSVTIENTSSETSIISSVLTGSTTLLSSTNAYNPELGVGRKFRFNAKGTIQTDNTSVDTLEVKIKLGSFTIGTTSAYTVHQNIPANTYFEIDATFTIRNSSIVSCNGKIFGTHNITRIPNLNLKGIYDQGQTVTTTADQIFDCTVKFDQADANNIIVINESTLEILN